MSRINDIHSNHSIIVKFDEKEERSFQYWAPNGWDEQVSANKMKDEKVCSKTKTGTSYNRKLGRRIWQKKLHVQKSTNWQIWITFLKTNKIQTIK